MTDPWFPQQSWIYEESNSLADADFNKPNEGAGEDHFAHAPGKNCKKCGRQIDAGQPARLRGEAEWVHESCPIL